MNDIGKQLAEFMEHPLNKVVLQYGDKTLGYICARLVMAETMLEKAADGLAEATRYGAGNWTDLINQIYDFLDPKENNSDEEQ